MVPWKGVGSVTAGVIATAALTGATIVLLPFLGLLTAEVVGNWLPVWVFAVPVAMSSALGGALTGYFHGDGPRRAAILGSIAVALGLAVIGGVVGLVALVLMLGMTPAYGQVDLTTATFSMMDLGGVVGLVSGAIVGAFGGAGGYLGRQELGP